MKTKKINSSENYACKVFVNGEAYDFESEDWHELSIKLNDIALKDFVSDKNENDGEIHSR